MEDSVFTKIIKGEIPCHKIYEDDKVLAFLDISPYTEGHTLVVPKQQVDHLWDIDEETYLYLMTIVRKVAKRQLEVLNPPRVALIVEGFAVPHAHVHVFPAYEGMKATIEHEIESPSDEQLAATAAKLAF